MRRGWADKIFIDLHIRGEQSGVFVKKRIISTLIVLLVAASTAAAGWVNHENHIKKPIHLLRKNNWTKVSEDIYVFSGEISENMTLVISGSDAAIIDTGTAPTSNSKDRGGVYKLKDVLEQKKLRVRNIIYTHYDYDHISNTELFIQNEPKGSVKQYNPCNVKDGQIIEMGDKVLKVMVTPGHSAINGGHISIELANENILVAGDILYTNFIPCMYKGDSPKAYMEILKRIRSKQYDLIIPGHGNILDSDYTVKRPLEYLTKTERLVARVLQSGGGLSEVRRKVILKDCFKDSYGINLLDGFILRMHRDNLRQFYAEMTGDTI